MFLLPMLFIAETQVVSEDSLNSKDNIVLTQTEGREISLATLVIFILLFVLIYLYKTIFYKKSLYIQRLHKNYVESIR
jgi:hypothetical protein